MSCTRVGAKQLGGGPFDIWGGVQENMEINKLFPSLLEIIDCFLNCQKKMDCFTPKITCLQA